LLREDGGPRVSDVSDPANGSRGLGQGWRSPTDAGSLEHFSEADLLARRRQVIELEDGHKFITTTDGKCYICSYCKSIPEFDKRYQEHLSYFEEIYRRDLTELGKVSSNRRLFENQMEVLEDKIKLYIAKKQANLDRHTASIKDHIGADEYKIRESKIPKSIKKEFRNRLLGRPGTPRKNPDGTQKIYKGEEHPRWAGASEWEVPGQRDTYRMLLLEDKVNGNKTWGWTNTHYEHILDIDI
jgi:hypothetical protein